MSQSNYFLQGASINTANTNISTLQSNTAGITNSSSKVSFGSSVALNNNSLYLRSATDGNHYLQYSSSRDGPYLTGYGGGSLAVNGTEILGWTGSQIVAAKDINCSGNVNATSGSVSCINFNSTNAANCVNINASGNISQSSGETSIYKIVSFPNNWLSSIDYNISSGNWLNGMSIGTGDGASDSTFNLCLRTWQGMALMNTSNDGNTGANRIKHYWNARSGNYTAKGAINANSLVTSGNILCGNNLSVTASIDSAGFFLSNNTNHNVCTSYYANLTSDTTISPNSYYQTICCYTIATNNILVTFDCNSMINGMTFHFANLVGSSMRFKIASGQAFSIWDHDNGTFSSSSTINWTNTRRATFIKMGSGIIEMFRYP
jgi:hypothetical protein